MTKRFAAVAAAALLASGLSAGLGAPAALAQQGDRVVNVYSARHYDSDAELFRQFTQATGIRVNVVEGEASQLIERMAAEGRNSPADVLITVDAGRLWRAQEAGVLQPVRSEALERAVPAHLREPGGHWFGLSARARVFVYARDRVRPADMSTYEDLADPKWRGRILTRSSTNIYSQSLVGALIAANGEQATEAWARGLAANLARRPQGGDTDQILAVAAGEGDLAISNTYYLGRLMASDKPEDRAVAEKVAVFFPNQDGRGTHVNISGAGVAAHAPNRENAVRFLEFMASPEAQRIFAQNNFEFPVVEGIPTHPVVAEWGPFKQDTLNAAVYGRNNQQALMVTDRAGWR
jgi:iron(III) transport system substrate-binding protein